MLSRRVLLAGMVMALCTGAGSAVYAAGAGTVQNMSGTLSAQRADGSVRVLSQKSEVVPGDVLTTQKDSYAQINFTDGSSITMRPNSQMKLEAYQFVQEQPENDNVLFRLVKGGLRTVTGFIGKRGNQDAYRINTATATIGIRGSGGDTYHNDDRGDANATYHKTYVGSYVMQTPQGQIVIGEGQVGAAKPGLPPQIIPAPPFPIVNLLQVGTSNVTKPGSDGCVVK